MVDSSLVLEKAVKDTVYIALDPQTIQSLSKSNEWGVALITGLVAIVAGLIPHAASSIKHFNKKKAFKESLDNELLYNWRLLYDHLGGLHVIIEELMEPKSRFISNTPFIPEFTLWKEIPKEKHQELLGSKFYNYSRLISEIESINKASPQQLYLEILKKIASRLLDPDNKVPESVISLSEGIHILSMKSKIVMIGKGIQSIDAKLAEQVKFDHNLL